MVVEVVLLGGMACLPVGNGIQGQKSIDYQKSIFRVLGCKMCKTNRRTYIGSMVGLEVIGGSPRTDWGNAMVRRNHRFSSLS
jgi:hypothetical protein